MPVNEGDPAGQFRQMRVSNSLLTHRKSINRNSSSTGARIMEREPSLLVISVGCIVVLWVMGVVGMIVTRTPLIILILVIAPIFIYVVTKKRLWEDVLLWTIAAIVPLGIIGFVIFLFWKFHALFLLAVLTAVGFLGFFVYSMKESFQTRGVGPPMSPEARADMHDRLREQHQKLADEQAERARERQPKGFDI